MICAARNEAHGFRVESWAEGRERSEDGADDRCRPTQLGSLCRGLGVRRPRHSLPGASRIRRRYEILEAQRAAALRTGPL
jgi:hypothetical protein